MPAHAEHLAPRLRGSADPRRRRTASAYPWRAAAVRRLLCFSLLLHRSAADRSNQFVQQMRRTATHIGDCTLCSLRFLFPHPRWLVPPCLPLWAAVCAFGKGDGASPRWDSIPSVLGRLCAFARGPRQDDRRAFSMVKQGEPCAPFFGCKVVGKAKKSGMASLCAVSYHKNRRFSHD